MGTIVSYDAPDWTAYDRPTVIRLRQKETDVETVADVLFDLGPVEAIKYAKFYFEFANDVWFVYADRSVIRVSFRDNKLDDVVSGEFIAEEYVTFLENVIRALGPGTILDRLNQLRMKEKLR